MTTAIKPEKKSGQQAMLQTRQEHHDAVVAENKKREGSDDPKLPVPELVKAGDTFMTGGKKTVVEDADVNTSDVRVICPANGKASGWAKTADAAVAAWNSDN